MEEKSLLLETHCHTIYSRDSLTTPAALAAACRRKGIDRVMVTDHNTIAGALEAHRLDPERVVVGEEIMTTVGELLAFYVREEVPPGLEPLEAIRRLRDQGAFISVSHPFDQTRKGHWPLDRLEEITPYVDAIEIFNARCLTLETNTRAQVFARAVNLPGTVGSDAHTAWELGRAVLRLAAFDGPDGLRRALPQAQIQARLSSPLIHLTSRWAVWYKKARGMTVEGKEPHG
jgi:predicted metal-dependent phosphoesterase TrpH